MLYYCRESEVPQENGGRKVYRAEVLKEFSNTAGRERCGTDEADGLIIDTGCAVGKRFSQGSPTVLVSQLFKPGTSLSLPTSLSQKEVSACERMRHRAWPGSAPRNGDGSKPLSAGTWQSSVHHLFEPGILYSVDVVLAGFGGEEKVLGMGHIRHSVTLQLEPLGQSGA